MKSRILFLIVALAFSTTSKAQYLCDVTNTLVQPGEQLHYQLYYNVGFVWIQAGACDFKVRKAVYNKKPVIQLFAQGKTQKSFDPFFKVRDTLVSYVDPETLLPYRAQKFTHEDNWHGIDDHTFVPQNGNWRVITRLKRKQEWRQPVEAITTKCGFDIMTSVYRLRCMDDSDLFVKGRQIDIPVRLDDDEYMVHLTYLGKERIKLFGDGYYSAHAFRLSLIEGTIFKRGDALKMWISDDGNRIPLMVETPIRVGYVKALFRSASNLKFPLNVSSSKK